MRQHVNTSTLSNDIKESLTDFAVEWKKLAKEIRSSLEWKEMVIYSQKENPSTHPSTTVYKVLTRGDSQAIPIGTTDISKVEIMTHLQKSSSNSKNRLSTLCLLLGNICSTEGNVNVSHILRKKKNFANLNYIEMAVTDHPESLMVQLNSKNVDFYLKLTVAGKFVVIRRYTITLSRKRNKRSSWSGATVHSIPYENLMPNYSQHTCCGCVSGCTPVGWAQIFAYYDRVAHRYGYRYSTSHWRGLYGYEGSPSYQAPASMNKEVEKYVEALRKPLKTICEDGSGSTTMSNTDNVDHWFRTRQGSGRVLRLSMSRIRHRVYSWVIRGYPVLNSHISGNKKNGSGHDAVVTKIRVRPRQYKSCRKVGWWLGRKTKCGWKTENEYQWYRNQGWGGTGNGWYSPTVTGAFVAVV